VVAIWWQHIRTESGTGIANGSDKLRTFFVKIGRAPPKVSLKISSLSPPEWADRATGDQYGGVGSTPDGGNLFLQTGTLPLL
jgi:hypothetical protein